MYLQRVCLKEADNNIYKQSKGYIRAKQTIKRINYQYTQYKQKHTKGLNPQALVNERQEQQVQGQKDKVIKTKFEVAYQVQFGDEVHVVGNLQQLGQWDVNKSLKLQWSEGDIWYVDTDLPSDGTLEFKYLILHSSGSTTWETGNNKSLEVGDVDLVVRGFWNQADTLEVEEQYRNENEKTEKIRSSISFKLSPANFRQPMQKQVDGQTESLEIPQNEELITLPDSKAQHRTENQDIEDVNEGKASSDNTDNSSNGAVLQIQEKEDQFFKIQVDNTENGAVYQAQQEQQEQIRNDNVQKRDVQVVPLNNSKVIINNLLAALSIANVGFSEFTLYKTGCGLPPGPNGLYGALEGVSYLYVLGYILNDFVNIFTRQNYLESKPSYAKFVGFLNISIVLSGLAVLYNQIDTLGYVPGILPNTQCYGSDLGDDNVGSQLHPYLLTLQQKFNSFLSELRETIQ